MKREDEIMMKCEVKGIIKKYYQDYISDDMAVERIMELFRNGEKKGGEQGSLHRVVGATVGAAGGQRKCPEQGCEGGWIFENFEPINGPHKCPRCKGAGVVCDTDATDEDQTSERTMQPSGSPPLGPQARSGEESELKRKYYELLYQVEVKIPDETRHETALRMLREATRRTGDGECSEHRGPNDKGDSR